MLKLYQDMEDGYGIPFIIDMGDGLTRWCGTPLACLDSYLVRGINERSTTPLEVGAELIGTYNNIEELKLELLLDE